MLLFSFRVDGSIVLITGIQVTGEHKTRHRRIRISSSNNIIVGGKKKKERRSGA
jgi:hypothetical protein